MKIAVKNYGVNAEGVDETFPILCAEIGDSDPLPSGFDEILTIAAFNTRKTSTQLSYNNNLNPARLAELKKRRIKDIDLRTDELLANGFVYNSKVFSLGKGSQINILGIEEAKDMVELTYPVKMNTIDDLETEELANAADARAFFLTALGSKRAVLDSGTSLKDSIRAAGTKTAIDGVLDIR